MTDYIEREEIATYLSAIPAADVVPWAWLEAYADGKRPFCSGFVIEAKLAYNEEENQ